MAGQPSTGDILEAVRNLHGDVKVALDRTEQHDKRLGKVEDTQKTHGLDIARAKGSASTIASLVAIGATVLVDLLKAAIGGGSHSS